MDRIALERHIAAHPITGTPEEMRAACEALVGALPAGNLASVGGVEGRWFGSSREAGVRPIVWLHGGGYVFGSSVTHGPCAGFLAKSADRSVFVPDYPLAPEHPWPAARDAAIAVLAALGVCDLVGDSAGGHLALVLAQRGDRDIRRLALISPNTDRTGRSRTRQVNSASDLMNDDEDDAALARLAFGDRPADDPEVSPLLASCKGLPPVYLTASTSEVLADDGLLLAQALGLADVPRTERFNDGLFHLWTLWPDILPEARRTLAEIAAFLSAGDDRQHETPFVS